VLRMTTSLPHSQLLIALAKFKYATGEIIHETMAAHRLQRERWHGCNQALRIMGSGFAARTFKNNQQAEVVYKQEEQDKAPVFMAEYRQPPASVDSCRIWSGACCSLALPSGLRRKATALGSTLWPSTTTPQPAVAAAKWDSVWKRKGRWDSSTPSEMQLLESGGAAAPLAKSGGKSGQMPVVTVSRQKAVSSQIAQVNHARASRLIAAHVTSRLVRCCSGAERASSFFKKTVAEEEEEEEAGERRQQNRLRRTCPRCRPRPPPLRRRRREVDGGSALQATGRRTGLLRLKRGVLQLDVLRAA
jgi:hypothetical protein